MSADVEGALLSTLVGDVDAFAAEHWGRRPLFRRTSIDPGELLDLDEAERLLLTGARQPTFRLVQDGATLPAARSTRAARLGGRTVEDVADLGRITEAVAGGATLVLQALQRTSLPIARFCRELERAISHPVQANAYLTPAGARGLAAHRDEHDVFVLQLDGSKRWTIAGLDPLDTCPGDVLYLPTGTEHAAEAATGPSLHLTLGVLTVTYGEVLRRALRRLEPELLSRPLPLGFAHPPARDGLRAGLDGALAATSAALASADPSEIADAEASRATARRGPLLRGQLDAVLRLGDLHLDDRLRRRDDHPSRLHATNGGVVLELVDRRVTFPVVARSALELVLATDEVRVGDLPGIDEASRLVVARRLVREGLVVPVPRGSADRQSS